MVAVKTKIKYLELKEQLRTSHFISQKTYAKGIQLLESHLLTRKQSKILLLLLEKHNINIGTSKRTSDSDEDEKDSSDEESHDELVEDSPEKLDPVQDMLTQSIIDKEIEVFLSPEKNLMLPVRGNNLMSPVDQIAYDHQKKLFYERYNSKEFKG